MLNVKAQAAEPEEVVGLTLDIYLCDHVLRYCDNGDDVGY